MGMTRETLQAAENRLNNMLSDWGSRDRITVDFEYGYCVVRRTDKLGNVIATLDRLKTKQLAHDYIQAMIQGYYITVTREG